MKILLAASEAAPYIKTGGLGDVIGALPKEIAKSKDTEICVFLPYYKSIKFNPDFKIEFVTCFNVMLAWRSAYVGVFKAVSRSKKLSYYFIDNEYYFNRDGAYGYYDDGERYAYFSKAVLEAIMHIGFYPDIIHCHDWQTALIPVFLKGHYNDVPEYQKIKTIFTIHNIEYQGKVPEEFLKEVIGLSEDWHDVMYHKDCLNFVKSAIEISDRVSTVSETYSYEIRHAYFAHGLESVLKRNEHKVWGIVNGIDTKLYDPATDEKLYVNYAPGEYDKKVQNKMFLQERLGLPVNPDVPMVAMVTRLVAHKGLELVEYVANEIMERDMQFVVVGTGDKRFEELFNYMAYMRPDRVSISLKFDPVLANQVYAGADMFLMPSKSEPCGLAQLIAMRYGTIPIVRETGGLCDTVPPLNTQTLEGRGFTFKGFNAHDMLGAIERSIDFYYDKEKLHKHTENIMKYDSSWKESVIKYMELYNNTLQY